MDVGCVLCSEGNPLMVDSSVLLLGFPPTDGLHGGKTLIQSDMSLCSFLLLVFFWLQLYNFRFIYHLAVF